MPKEQVRRLIGPVYEDAALLHGTAVEAALMMFETGALPAGRKRCSCAKELRTRFYLMPVTEELPAEYRDRFPGFDRAETLFETKSYAESNAEDRYTIAQLVAAGLPERKATMICCEWAYGTRHRIPGKERARAESIDYGELRAGADKRKGVLVEIDKTILGLNIEKDPDGDGLFLHFPRGLPAKYVRRIEPQGPEERQTLDDYLARIS